MSDMANIKPVPPDLAAYLLREHFGLEQAVPRFGRPVVVVECDPEEQAAEDLWLARMASRVARGRLKKERDA